MMRFRRPLRPLLTLPLAAGMLAGCVMVIPVPLPPLPAGGPAPVGPASAGPIPAPPCAPDEGAAAARAELLSRLNAARGAQGLGPLAASARLDAIAQGHACDIAARGSVSHIGADGSDLPTRLARGGYRHGVAAENTGRGYTTAEAAVAGWLASPGHRANILHPRLREAGLGLARGADGRRHWVLLLAEPR